MGKNLTMYESTRDHILKAKEKLSKGELLTGDDAKKLLQMREVQA